MTDPDDPSRLFDAPDAPAGLKNALRAAQADVGNAQQMARLAQRLGPLLGATAATGAGAGAAASAKLGGAAKLGIAAAALVAVGSATLFVSSPPSAPTPKPSRSAVASTAPAPVAPPVFVAPPATLSAPAELAPPPSSASAALTHGKPPAATPPSEAELLEQARAAIKTDPSRALQRANEHARRFPRGVLVQEREVLAIQALRRLGRDAEADRRADAFGKAFPGSAFQRKLKSGP
jgi:hypothetical protein